MSFLVVLILNDLDQCPTILDDWEAAGVHGVTIFESIGLGRLRQKGLRDDMPLMPSLRDLFGGEEIHHRTLFSVVPDQKTVDLLVDLVHRRLGNLDEPNSGFMFVVPVLQVYGLGRKNDSE